MLAADGQLLTYTDFNGKTRRYEYDTYGKLSKIYEDDGRVVEMGYDTYHRVNSHKIGTATLNYSFNNLHQVTRFTDSVVGASIDYQYLAGGLRKQLKA